MASIGGLELDFMKKDIIFLQMMMMNAVVATTVMSGHVTVRMVVGTGNSSGDGEHSVDNGDGGGGTDRRGLAVVVRRDDDGERQCE